MYGMLKGTPTPEPPRVPIPLQIPIRVAKHIYRGPKSVFRPPGFRQGGRRPVCDIIQMWKMTPRALAYVAVQARFAISDAQEWHNLDCNFNYEIFFWNMVELLSGKEGKEILTFYDWQVLGLPGEEPAMNIVQAPQVASSMEHIKAQHAEKCAHLASTITV